jgi:hypothetical protein
MIERCFTCDDLDITGNMEAHYANDCPSRNAEPNVQELVGALMFMDFCDHYCCGMPVNLCKATSLNYWLKEHGWVKQEEPK